MYGRPYSISFSAIATAALQDLVSVKCPANMVLAIRRIHLGHVTATPATEQMMRLRCRHHDATATNGSGGNVGDVRKLRQGDAAATLTARINDTTQMVPGSASLILWTGGAHLYAGFDWVFRDPPIITPGCGFSFELLTGLSGSDMSGGLEVEEIG